MQDVPLPGSTIHAGAKVIGRVIDVKPAKWSAAARQYLFDLTRSWFPSGNPITTNLRAAASMMAVEAAQLPESGPDRGTSQNAWTTDQIGGEVVYRGGGPVADGLRPVGEPTYGGVLVHVSAKPGTPCRGEIEGNDRLQALWVFSSDACGIYDFADLKIVALQAGVSGGGDHVGVRQGRGECQGWQRNAIARQPDIRAMTVIPSESSSI